MKRAASDDWPRLLTPAPGCYPLAAGPRADERVLHIALRTPHERNHALAVALYSIASHYREVDWRNYAPGQRIETICFEAAAIKPTLVFMQLQCDDALAPHDIDQLRACCDPGVVIVNWDGDQHYALPHPRRRWFAELGRVCDASLVPNTLHAATYAAHGVRHPGYLQVGFDADLYRPVTPAPHTPPIVLLASFRNTMHHRRSALVQALRDVYPKTLGLYGDGWWALELPHCPMLKQHEEAAIYAGARASLSMSIVNDLPRYTSDRLFRLLGAAGLPVVERFADCDGLGLRHGDNCLLWDGWDELLATIEQALAMPDAQQEAMRAGALVLSRDHTWAARMPELLACVDAVRAARQA